MIRIGLDTAVGVYLAAALVFFMVLWWVLFRRRKSAEEWNVTDHAQRCPYCGHIFVDHGSERGRPVKCPVCESYLEVGKGVPEKTG